MMKKHLIYRPKYFTQGSTILEVMVSVLLLTFGVLALMAAQIRSVSSIAEAENRSLISQAAEALAEGMQINSTLVNQNGSYTHSYSNYTGKGVVAVAKNMAKPTAITSNATLNKAALANAQLAEFQYALSSQIPDADAIAYTVCMDNAGASPPTMNNSGTMAANCAQNGTVTTIKVAWRMKNNKSDDSSGIVYSYMLQVAN